MDDELEIVPGPADEAEALRQHLAAIQDFAERTGMCSHDLADIEAAMDELNALSNS